MVQPLPDTDRDWLKALEEALWPPKHKNGVVSLEASRKLSEEEYETLTRILEEDRVVVEMVSTNMFGGYGICLYEHEMYPHTGAQYLCCIIEGHLPATKTRYEREVPSKGSKGEPDRIPGSGSTRAWDYFAKYTHTPAMKAFCIKYRLKQPEARYNYDY
jgi:hypothetical protein